MLTPRPKSQSGQFKREVGLIGLCFVAVSGMLGGGWLFVPLMVSQQAGPASVLSWIAGGLMILLITLTFAEISSLLPTAGGIVRLPHFSYGNVVSMAMGFTAWMGHCLAAPIAAEILLEYAGHNFPWLYVGAVSDNVLSPAGIAVAAVLIFVMVLINIISVRALAQCITFITWFKILIPIVIGVAIIAAHFNIDNFFGTHGFAPFGLEGVLGGIASGGVIFAFVGFRHAIDFAAEARNPQVTIPWALAIAVVICILIYALIQTAFVGALPASDLADGWGKLKFSGQLGPLADIATALGLVWIGAIIYGGAIIAPFGGALVATGSNARLALALSRNGYLYPFFDFLSQRGVPVRALILNYIVGMILLMLLRFDQMVTLNIATLVLSLCVGPLSVCTFRQQLPNRPRGYTLPMVGVTAPTAFVFAVLILYWAGWETMWHMAIVLVGGALFFAVRVLGDRALLRDLQFRQAGWLLPLLAGIWIISYLGNFGGGLGVIPFGWDLLCCAVLALGVFYYAIRCGLTAEQVQRYVLAEFPEERETSKSG